MQLTLFYQKPIPFPGPSRSNACDTPPSSTRARRLYMGDPTHQNAPQIPDCPNNPDRIGMSCMNVYLSLHQFSPHTNCALAWSQLQIHWNLHGGGMTCIRMWTCQLCSHLSKWTVMNFDQRYSHVYILINWLLTGNNRHTPRDPAWPSPTLRSGVYLRGKT